MSCQREGIGRGWRGSIWRGIKSCMRGLNSRLHSSPESNIISLIPSVLYQDNEKVIRKMTLKPYQRDNEFE